MPSPILVTGATGFVGRHLCKALKDRGELVRVLARSSVDGPWNQVFTCDLGRDPIPPAALKDVHVVFHLAGVAHALKPDSNLHAMYRRVNVEGTRDLLQAATDQGVGSFVNFSSVKAAADPGEDCVDETWTAVPEDVYGATKREAEALVIRAGLGGRMRCCNLRPALVYGTGVKGNLERMIHAVARHRFPPVADTHNRRSLVHVLDLVRAAFLCAENPEASGKTYIVTDGRPYSTREIYEWIQTALGRPVPAWEFPDGLLRGAAAVGSIVEGLTGLRLPMTRELYARIAGSACYSSNRIETELGFRPTHNLRDSMWEMARHALESS